jgi:carbamoyltransferase
LIHLGINQDRYDSGVTLSDGEGILYAANEERFTRKKTQGGFPWLALESAFRYTGINRRDVDEICLAGVMTPPLPLRAFPALQNWVFALDRTGEAPLTDWVVDQIVYRTPMAHQSSDSLFRRVAVRFLDPAVRRTLDPQLRRAKLRFVEHHEAHAAAAFHLSGFETALALTIDCMGDGLSATASHCSPGRLDRLWSADSHASIGQFYEMITAALGFIPSQQEGKVTGLAATGDPGAVTEPSPFTFEGETLRYTGFCGRRGVLWAREKLVARHRREDVARWAQEVLEATVVQVARRWLRHTQLRRLVLAGGVFANVSLNRRLQSLDEVDEIFVCPNMGDGGLGLGAIAASGGLRSQRVADVFWGEDFSPEEIGAAVHRSGAAAERIDNIDLRIAELIAGGNLVALFRGRMEWGPRALGNRSILARADDPTAPARLNALLQRDDFMPFAPAVMAEDAGVFINGLERAAHAAEFMTTCFEATAQMRSAQPAVVHVDGTTRAQVVRAHANPGLHGVLRALKAITGAGIALNTSFNVHEEPIVRTPDEAISTFRRAGLDFLVLGDCLVRGEQRAVAARERTL